MKNAINKSKEINEKIDKIFEGIFSVGASRSKDYSSRGEKKREAIWTKGVSKNSNAYIEYIKNVDGAYSSELPDNQLATSFLNKGSYNANLVILERDNIRFVGDWEDGLFENAKFTTTTLYPKPVFKGGTFKNAIFDCEYEAWQTEPENFLGGKITKIKDGLLGMKYHVNGDYNSIYLFLIPVGSYLVLKSSGGNKAYKMIKSLDSTGSDIILEDVTDGKRILLPWSRLNPGAGKSFFQISINSSYSILGVKNKISNITITNEEPTLGPKSSFKSVTFPKDSILSKHSITVNLKTPIEIKVYQNFLDKTKTKTLEKALEHIKSAKKFGYFDSYTNIENVEDDDLKKSLEIVNAFKFFSLTITKPNIVSDIKKEIKNKFGIDLDAFPKKI